MIWMASLLACLTVGDSVEEDAFAQTFAPVFCAKERECRRGLYQSLYYGRRDCITTWEGDLSDQVDSLADRDCGYDASAAAAAFESLRDMTCDDYYEGEELAELVADVWSGCAATTGYTTTYYYYGYAD